MPSTVETFRCMMCGHEFQDKVEKGEDRERSCPKCRSNSIRHLKSGGAAPGKGPQRPEPSA